MQENERKQRHQTVNFRLENVKSVEGSSEVKSTILMKSNKNKTFMIYSIQALVIDQKKVMQ